MQPAFWQGWVVALQQGKSRSLAHLREKVVLCCTFSALFFFFYCIFISLLLLV